LLCGLQDGLTERLGNRNWQEQALEVELILAKFIDDSHLTVLEGRGIGKCHIDLPFLKRGGIPPVVYAYE